MPQTGSLRERSDVASCEQHACPPPSSTGIRTTGNVAGLTNFAGSWSNFCLHEPEQKKYDLPACSLSPAAVAGSIFIPQTGSVTAFLSGTVFVSIVSSFAFRTDE